MLSAGLESLLDSPGAAVLELYPGLPGSVSTELMAVPGPALGLGAQPEGSGPVLTHRDAPWTSGAGNFCQNTEDLGDVLEVVSHRPAESLPEELLQPGDLEGNENSKKRHFRKVDCSSDGCQKEDEEAQGAEDHHAEGSAFTPGETCSKQEDLPFAQQEAKPSRAHYTEVAGSLRSTEENQANVQVTAETLPKLPEEVQGMKADGTRMFSKAGYRSDRVRKGLPAESKECPDVDTVLARAGVTQTSILDFLEPFRVLNVGAATHHPQETDDCTGLEAHTATRAGGSGVSALETEEEKLPTRNPVNEFSASLAHCQTCQQDEEHDARDFCKGAVPRQNDSCGLSSAGSCRTSSTASSGVFCPVLKSSSCLDFRNMPVENSSAAVHGIINEPPPEYLPQHVERHTRYDHGTGFVGSRSSTSVPVEQIPAVRNKGLSSAKTDPREFSAGIGKSYSSQFGESAEVRRKIAVGDNMEVWSRPEAPQGVEHCHSSVFSSAASFPEEFSKEKFQRVPSEAEKLKKDQWQFSLSDLCKDGIKENSLLMETGNIASRGTGERDTSSYNTSKKIPPPRHHSCLDLSSKQEKDPPKAQLLAKDSESNTTSDGLAGGVAEAAEADGSDSLSTGKETHLFYTLNVNLPPILQKSREPHHNECPCTANEVSHRDKGWDNLSGKETVGASGTTGEQVTAVLLHKDKFKSSVSSRTFYDPNMAHRVSQKDMESAGNLQRVGTGLENEHYYTQHCSNHGMKDQSPAASASCIVSGSARVGEVFLNSHSVDVDKKIEEHGNSGGESSTGYNSQEAAISPEARIPLACGSPPCEDDWGYRAVALHGRNDIPIGKPRFCSAYTAEKSAATLARDEISNKNMKVVKLFDVCEVAQGSEVVCDRDEAKEQKGACASQREQCDGTRTVASPNAPEGNQGNQSSEQLLARYLDKTTCAHSFGFRSSLGTQEQGEVPSLPADPSDCSTSGCAACPAPASGSIPAQRASHREPTLCPRENRGHGCPRELGGPGPGRELCSETSPHQAKPGLQTTDSSEEESESGSSVGDEVVLKAGADLPLLMHRYTREDRLGGTLQENVENLDSVIGVGNKDCSGYVGSINDLTEEKTIKPKEQEDDCETGREGTPEEQTGKELLCSSESEARGSQHCCTKPAQEKAELVFAGNKTQPSLPKMKSLVEDQENTVSAQFLPISSIHGTSMLYNPENTNELSDTEHRESLSIKPVLNNTCPQVISEPGKETSAPKAVGPSHSGKFDIQEPFNKTQVDSETQSALSCGISLPEKEQLCMSPENEQRENCEPSAAKVFSKDSSMTKIVSVTISVKRKCSNIEIPSSENEMAAGSLTGAKSSRVCAHSKESLKGEGHCSPTDMDGTSPKSPPCEEKFKNTSEPENTNELSDTEHRESLSIKPLLSNTCPQVMSEPGKETSAPRAVGPSHSGKFDIQEPFNKTQVDSETQSAVSCGITLPEKETCMSPENEQRENLFSDKKFSKDSSMTKILSVIISVKRKCSNIEIPSSENEMAAGSLTGAKSSRVCAHSKESLKGEGHCSPTDMDGTSPKSPPCEEKFKNTCVEEKLGEEIAPRKKLLRSHPWASLEDSKESGGKIVPLGAENHGKVLEEIPRSNLNYVSNERSGDGELPNVAGTRVLSAALQDCQAVSEAGASPGLQGDPPATLPPPLSSPSARGTGPCPGWGVCRAARVPYRSAARSTEQQTGGNGAPGHSSSSCALPGERGFRFKETPPNRGASSN
ncbi:uncharacterized protein LOC126641768 isoform X1 [Myiozetetes cayanensis]|uniref:uncharacterized protein LOC126641768 isoform X1 n=1 Tax=Myiozetetes cayanensis TaxID=478635 RepID=UPI002160D3A1|nr:uncharacterized protein LOC126641768 isoform X1 [Myiozetetes cayanensis]